MNIIQLIASPCKKNPGASSGCGRGRGRESLPAEGTPVISAVDNYADDEMIHQLLLAEAKLACCGLHARKPCGPLSLSAGKRTTLSSHLS